MDAIHNPEIFPWIGEKIVLKEYFEKFRELVFKSRSASTKCKGDLSRLEDYNVKSLVETVETEEVDSKDVVLKHEDMDQLYNELYEELELKCNFENLTTPYELSPTQAFLDPGPTTESERQSESNKYPKYHSTPIPEIGKQTLQCLDLQSKFLENATCYDKHKRSRISRHPNDNWLEAAPPMPTILNNKVTEQEIVIVVRIYRPIKKEIERYSINLGNMRYVQELYLLGSNMLSELRDHIKCNVDMMVGGDMSDMPPWKERDERLQRSRAIGFDTSHKFGRIFASPPPRKLIAKEEYPSGFFHIEGCFYNDLRWPNCNDNSEVIREWASDPKRKIGPFTTAKMEDTRMEDLTIRFGYPYVYVHQGDHEHLFSFIDARLLSVDDVHKPSRYPFERSVGTQHSRFCMICDVSVARYITTDNERVPETPFFFCDVCFRSYNYNDRGEKMGTFKAYHYVDVNAL